MAALNQMLYLARWFAGARFFKQHKPLQTVLFVTDACNLSCKHCTIWNHANPRMKPYEKVREELQYSYALGSRFVDFEGGEPTLWREGDRNLNDLIQLAKQIGFFSCTVTTNAQRPFADVKADSFWVSMDGVGELHDDIRGAGAFARLEENIAACGHRHVSVNMTINTRNYTDVEKAIRYVADNPHLEQISFSFHTPYAGTEHLFLDWERRAEVADLIIRMKREGYPIMNSRSGLTLLKTNDFKKECWVSNFILPDGTRLNECAGKTAGVCDRCGFGMAGEMRSVFDFKPDTLRSGLRLRVNT